MDDNDGDDFMNDGSVNNDDDGDNDGSFGNEIKNVWSPALPLRKHP